MIHPGGFKVLMDNSGPGKDATLGFEEAGHSKSAQRVMEKYCIGVAED